jgi:adenine/guanine phosphoribosyltransferase-like PRPP-binding protein
MKVLTKAMTQKMREQAGIALPFQYRSIPMALAEEINRSYVAIPSTQAQNLPRDQVYTAGNITEELTPVVKNERAVISSHASYLSNLFDDTAGMVARFRAKVRHVDFDTLVGTGLSGALAAQLLAQSVSCHFAVVRKSGESTHSNNTVEGVIGKRWLFVDDLVASGETRSRVKTAMQSFCEIYEFESVYVGDYLYYNNTFHAKEDGNV